LTDYYTEILGASLKAKLKLEKQTL